MEEEVVSVLRRNGAALIGFSSGRGITVPAAMLAEIPLLKGTRADPDEIIAKTAEKAGAYCLRQVLSYWRVFSYVQKAVWTQFQMESSSAWNSAVSRIDSS